ncbi:MAG: pseudouridine synthase, partial [Aquabacterium sp.]
MAGPPDAARANETWTLIHADAQLLVVSKPAGLLSVPGRGPDKADCLSARVQAQYPDATIVHRLDQATSGLMLLARGADMQRRLSAAFEQRQVDKRYVAWVSGRPLTDDGEIRLPIGADWADRPRRRIDTTAGRASHTIWRVLRREP